METSHNTMKLAQQKKISSMHCVVVISLCCALLGPRKKQVYLYYIVHIHICIIFNLIIIF